MATPNADAKERADARSAASNEPAIVRPPDRVDRLLIPASILDTTLYGLALGRDREMLCYWIGCSLPNDAEGHSRAAILTVSFPQIESTYGSFRVLDGQMSQITAWCSRNGLWILGQVHTHPTDEPHSEADECWPASHRRGFFSVVIPFFAQFSTVREPQWRAHEVGDDSRWAEINPAKRFEVVSDVWLPSALV
ncbi:MAG: hypothetical protein JWL61_1091 [Gemmatimonadetes bacterium]|nr:hypothetical protein [Gemmatimonadota bacterium]